jgi:PKD repeat protein
MKKLLLSLLSSLWLVFSVYNTTSYAQGGANCSVTPNSCNLVNNGDFEAFTGSTVDLLCLNQFNRACGWYASHSEYFHRNATMMPCVSNLLTLPYNFASGDSITCGGFDVRINGNAYAGLVNVEVVYHPVTNQVTSRSFEYLTGRTKQPLEIGKKYYVEFWQSLGLKFSRATTSMGIALTVDSFAANVPVVLHSPVFPAIPSNAQIINNKSLSVMQSRGQWKVISGIIESASNHRYVTIGCYDEFVLDVPASSGPVCTTNFNYPYYLVDDVSLIELPKVKDTLYTVCRGNSVNLSAPNLCLGTISQSDFYWFDGNQSYPATNLVVTPNDTTFYQFVFAKNGDTSVLGEITIHVKPGPVLNDTTYLLCYGDSLLFECDTNINCVWNSDLLVNSVNCPFNFNLGTSSSFQVICTHLLTGCSDISIVNFDVIDVQDILGVNELEWCLGNPLSISTNQPFDSIEWSSSPFDPLINSQQGNTSINVVPIVNTYYYVKVKTGPGCVFYDTVLVKPRTLSEAKILASIVPNCQRLGTNADFGGDPGNGVTDTCFVSCEQSVVKYYSFFNPAFSYTWSITGALQTVYSGDTAIVSWGAVGNGIVSLTVSGFNGCTKTSEVCVNIVPSPIAGFTSTNITQQGIEACINTPIQFINTSNANQGSQPLSYFWVFGDGTVAATSGNASHTYITPGTYSVTLTVTNGCKCEDKISRLVVVSGTEGPAIENCRPVVCPGEVISYSTNTVCSTYDWQVSGGNILSAQPYGSTISVQWGNGTTGPGRVQLFTPCTGSCPASTVLEVPIISLQEQIKGDNKVCKGEEVFYNISLQPGTTYQWQVTGGTIRFGQGTHEIAVVWDSVATSGTVTVDYGNPFLQCSGTSSLNIMVRPSYQVNGPAETCKSAQYTTNLGYAMNWRVLNSAGQLLQSVNNVPNFLVNFPGPGRYTVVARPVDTTLVCNDFGNLVVNVTQGTLPFSGSITGPSAICPGQAYTYSLSNPLTQATITWAVTGGTPTSGTGLQQVITWNPVGPYRIIVTASADPLGCATAKDTLVVSPIQTNSFPGQILGPDTVCANTLAYFTLSAPAEGYTWEIANSQSGSIDLGQGTQAISVLWNNTNAPITTTLRVRPVLCNNTLPLVTKTIVIRPLPTAGIVGDTLVCQGDTATYSTTGLSGAFFIWKGEGVKLLGNATGNSVSFTFPSEGNHLIRLTVGNPNGCATTIDRLLNINVKPKPIASASVTAGKESYCTLEPIATVLNATQSAGVSFQWLNNGVDIGGSASGNSSYIVTSVGAYSVRITSAEGCVNTSAQVLITQGDCQSDSLRFCEEDSTLINNVWLYYECCTYDRYLNGSYASTYTLCDSAGGLSSLCPNENINPIVTSNSCGQVSASIPIALNGVVDLRWDFEDPLDTMGYAQYNMDTAVQYGFGIPGDYRIRVNYSRRHPQDSTLTCSYQGSTVVRYAYKPDFTTRIVCDGGSYAVYLKNTTTYIGSAPSYFEVELQWPNSGFQPAGTVAIGAEDSVYLYGLNNASLGIFDLKLIGEPLSVNNRCEITKTLQLPALPNASFSPSLPACEDVPVTFTNTSSPDSTIIEYRWSFGDGAELIRKEALRTYDQGGPIRAFLKVTDRFGCFDIDSSDFGVSPEVIVGSISSIANQPVCAGDTIQLFFQINPLLNGDNGPFQFLWSTGQAVDTLDVLSTDRYTVRVKSLSTGCVEFNVPSFGAVVKPNPIALVNGPALYCLGDSVRLSTQASPGFRYTWWLGSDTVANGTASAIVLPADSAGQFSIGLRVVDTASFCGSDAGIFPFRVLDPPLAPVISISGPQPYCEGPLRQLTATSPAAYLYWSTGVIGPSIQVSKASRYKVTAVDTFGCSTEAETEIYLKPDFAYFLEGCYEVCDGQPPLEIPGIPGQHQSYIWLYNGSNVASGTPLVLPLGILGTGSYQLIAATFPVGCVDTSGILNLEVEDCQPCNAEIETVGGYCALDETGKVYYVLQFRFNNYDGNMGSYTASIAGVPVATFSSTIYGDGSLQSLYLSDSALVALMISGHCIDFEVELDGIGTCLISWCPDLNAYDCGNLRTCTAKFTIDRFYCSGYTPALETEYVFEGTYAGNPQLVAVQFVGQGVGLLSYSISPGGQVSIRLAGNVLSLSVLCLRMVFFEPGQGLCEVIYCMQADEMAEQVANNGDCPLSRSSANTQQTTATGWSLYPNPAADQLYLSSAASKASIWIKVIDQTGKERMSRRIEPQGTSYLLEIHSLNPGLYSLLISTEEGSVERMSFSIIR